MYFRLARSSFPVKLILSFKRFHIGLWVPMPYKQVCGPCLILATFRKTHQYDRRSVTQKQANTRVCGSIQTETDAYFFWARRRLQSVFLWMERGRLCKWGRLRKRWRMRHIGYLISCETSPFGWKQTHRCGQITRRNCLCKRRQGLSLLFWLNNAQTRGAWPRCCLCVYKRCNFGACVSF